MYVPPMIDDSWYAEPEEPLPTRESAGGVVVRIERGALLVALVREIESRGETLPGYVLPKGGLEAGEDRSMGARREIQEEIGLTEVNWLMPLITIIRLNLYRTVWTTNHYDLFSTQQLSGEILDKEHHFDMGWFPIDDLPELYWPCERSLLTKHRKRIYDAVIDQQNPQKRKAGFM